MSKKGMLCALLLVMGAALPAAAGPVMKPLRKCRKATPAMYKQLAKAVAASQRSFEQALKKLKLKLPKLARREMSGLPGANRQPGQVVTINLGGNQLRVLVLGDNFSPLIELGQNQAGELVQLSRMPSDKAPQDQYICGCGLSPGAAPPAPPAPLSRSIIGVELPADMVYTGTKVEVVYDPPLVTRTMSDSMPDGSPCMRPPG